MPQRGVLEVAADHRRHPDGARIEARIAPALGLGLPRVYRLGDALDALLAEIGIFERIRGQHARALAHYHAVRDSQGLQARGDIGDVANCSALLLVQSITLANDHQSGVDADTHLQRLSRLRR